MDRCEHLIDSASSTILWNQLAAGDGFLLTIGVILLALVGAGVATLRSTEQVQAVGYPPRPSTAMAVLPPLIGACLIGLYMFSVIGGAEGCERLHILGLLAAWPFAVALLGVVIVFYLLTAEHFRLRRIPGAFLLVCVLVSVHLAAASFNLAGAFGETTELWKLGLAVGLGVVAGAIGALVGSSGFITRAAVLPIIVVTLLLSIVGFGYVLTLSADEIIEFQGSDELLLAIDSPLVLAPLLCLLAGSLLPERAIRQYGLPFGDGPPGLLPVRRQLSN